MQKEENHALTKIKPTYTRRQLQNAMIELLEEKPFEKITINDIASHVHVNRSTVYRYYDDKL